MPQAQIYNRKKEKQYGELTNGKKYVKKIPQGTHKRGIIKEKIYDGKKISPKDVI